MGGVDGARRVRPRLAPDRWLSARAHPLNRSRIATVVCRVRPPLPDGDLVQCILDFLDVGRDILAATTDRTAQ